MNHMTTHFPNYTHGSDAIASLPSIVSALGEKILIVGGETAIEKSRMKIEKAFDASGIKKYEFFWYGGECCYENIQKVQKKIENEKFDLVLGLGGGKALDTAKAAADMAGLEIVTLPTIAATCAATTALSVVYEKDGSFKEIYYLKKTPIHSVIDLEIIANSPRKYLWAGIGDTIAKYYEAEITQRGNTLSYNNTLGKTISSLCVEPLIQYGVQALEDIDNQRVSFELEQVVLNNIVSTGFVSFLIDQKYNGAVAHGLFYGLTLLEEIEENHLHGEAVAFGVLVLLKIDGNDDAYDKLYKFYKEAGLPTSLKDLGISMEESEIEAVLKKAVDAPDMNKMPFKITREILVRALEDVEKEEAKRSV